MCENRGGGRGGGGERAEGQGRGVLFLILLKRDCKEKV